MSVDNWQQIPQLSQFYDDLASHPYCTNSKGFTYIRTKSHAIRHTYIQPNHPAVIKWLVFDIDDPQALFAYYDNCLPRPQIIVKNPDNGHAHYCYRLTAPVSMWGDARTKPVEYLGSVYRALAEALGADPSYSGNLIKNPCNPQHETYITGAKPSYTLTELADYLDLEPIYPQINQEQEPANDSGYGRNCSLFEELRHLAYKCENKSFNAIESYLKPIAEKLNYRFDVPLDSNEVKHIIRSIARYCAKMDFTASHKAFSKRQATRGARGGKAKGMSYDKKRQQAKELYEQGLNKSEIARKLEVSRRSIINWLNNLGCENSHNQVIAAGSSKGASALLPCLMPFTTLVIYLPGSVAPIYLLSMVKLLAGTVSESSVLRPWKPLNPIPS